MSYSKLHSSIVNSSLWSEPDYVRLLFITLLAACDRDGVIYGTKSGLSRLANIDPDDIDEAWHALMSPDKESSDRMRAPEHEGRRIEEVSGGYRLLNFSYYRGLRNDDDRRDQNREAQARFKAKVSQGKPASAKISQGNPPKAHAEAEAEAHTDPLEGFDEFWKNYPKKNGKKETQKRWAKMKPSPNLRATIIQAITAQRETRKWRDGFAPDPLTFLNGERWNDEAESPAETFFPL